MKIKCYRQRVNEVYVVVLPTVLHMAQEVRRKKSEPLKTDYNGCDNEKNGNTLNTKQKYDNVEDSTVTAQFILGKLPCLCCTSLFPYPHLATSFHFLISYSSG